ncbi:MAG: hypothetical protein WBV82_20055 [Myxococcaceae bacterium]
MNDASDNPVSPAIESLIELFRTELGEVRFPDVDGDSLSAAASEVRDASCEVVRAEEALAAAMRELAQRQDQLLQKSQRALAYARIFAEENPELLARLDTVQLPRAGRDSAEPAVVRRRGRPRKSVETVTELFQQDVSASA